MDAMTARGREENAVFYNVGRFLRAERRPAGCEQPLEVRSGFVRARFLAGRGGGG